MWRSVLFIHSVYNPDQVVVPINAHSCPRISRDGYTRKCA